MTTGIVTQHGPAVMHRGVVVQLPAEHTPLGAAVAAAVAAIDRGEVQPCPHCGAAGECEQPSADPHGDLSAWLDTDITF